MLRVLRFIRGSKLLGRYSILLFWIYISYNEINLKIEGLNYVIYFILKSSILSSDKFPIESGIFSIKFLIKANYFKCIKLPMFSGIAFILK